MTNKYISLYKKYHILKDDERLGLFQILNDTFFIKKVLYPGCYAHITPALVFPVVIFNDVYKKLQRFYESEEIREYVNSRKHYQEVTYFSYINADYQTPLPINEEDFDLLISQYSGFVSRSCIKYLKIGGILVANNSHGDASMASILPNYQFIAVVNKRNNGFKYSNRNIEQYFIPKKPVEVTKKFLEKHGRGIGYTKYATDYIFKRIE